MGVAERGYGARGVTTLLNVETINLISLQFCTYSTCS